MIKEDSIFYQEPCDDAISRILKKMWNCRGKHTISIDKVAMEQIIRDELSVTQKPIECDDAIDREYLFKVLDDFCGHDRTATITLDTLADLVYDMPSVTQKSGKWLITHLSNMAYCSECDYLFKDIPASIVEHFKHCPNCGTKMEMRREDL